MVEADDAGYLPPALFVLPEIDESALSRRVLRPGMIEAVPPDFHGAIALDTMHLECTRDQFSPHISPADILPNVFGQCFHTTDHAILVMIKLQIVCEELTECV